mmetsp:Transcript_46756/g.105735  ORF Transcript_46756/g.105735 Transcript_46756/m.105735 type:complete len:540 (-) Transcript_46756:192-1811(-)
MRHNPLSAPLLSAQLQVSVRQGCLELRVTLGDEARSSTMRIPAWPPTVQVIYGWRSLEHSLQLRAALTSGVAEYVVSKETLHAMNLLEPSTTRKIYVRGTVSVRCDFGDGLVLNSERVSLGAARPTFSTGLLTSTLGRPSTNSGPQGRPSSSVTGGSSVSLTAGSEGVRRRSAARSSGGDHSDFEDEGWNEDRMGRMCFLSWCAPCYKSCVCFWHVARSTPTNSLLCLGSAVTVVIIYQSFLPELVNELKAADLTILPPLDSFMRSTAIILLVFDSMFVVLSALLTGTTKEIFCKSVKTGVLEYSPTGRWQCGLCASCIRWYGGMSVLSLLVLAALGTVILGGLLLAGTSCAWFAADVASYSCELSDDDVQGTTDSVFRLFGEALKYVDFDNFDYQAYCLEDSSSGFTTAPGLARYEAVYQYTTVVLVSSGALFLAQVFFFAIMVENHRIARSATAEMEANQVLDMVNRPSFDRAGSLVPAQVPAHGRQGECASESDSLAEGEFSHGEAMSPGEDSEVEGADEPHTAPLATAAPGMEAI